MPVPFNQAWRWDESVWGPYERVPFYPNNADLFIKVAGGISDQNIIYAELVNRIQNSIVAVERQVQYTPKTANTTGSFIFQFADFRTIGWGYRPDYEDRWRAGVKFTVRQDIANEFFGGKAFNSTYGVACAGVAFHQTGRGNTYFPCACGFNVTGDNTGILTIVRQDAPWKLYDQIEVCLYVIRA